MLHVASIGILAFLVDGDGSNPLCVARVEALYGVVQTQKHKLDCLEQTISDLTRIMGNINRDRKEERNFLGDMPRDRLNPKPIPEDPPR